MKRNLLIVATFSIMAILFSHDARSQEGSSLKVSFFGNTSAPSGEYKDGIGRARKGFGYGLSADYFFPGSRLGIGIDARFANHGHLRGDTIFERSGFSTRTVANTYSSPLRFRHYGITLGPVYRIGEGKLGIELYAKSGMLFQQFPTYVRREVIVLDPPLSNGPPTTIINEKPSARDARANTLTALMGARVSFKVFPRLELFVLADYQTCFGKNGSFSVHDQSGQVVNSAGTKMMGLGGGIRLNFGESRDPSSLSRNY